MNFPIYYLVTGTEGAACRNRGLDVSFTGTVANVTVSNVHQYEAFWAVRLEWLRNHVSTMTVDTRVRDLIDRFGVHEVLAAYCRECERRGMPILFRKLNRVYEWLVTP